jgi:hypothetical protein
MIEIWFHNPRSYAQWDSVTVNSDIKTAQQMWDVLNAQYEMKSERP